ncbi:MAG: HPF/RaiA family ribosome-associated protein [Planctomycetota bacterium]|nr:MAG: HPF/RaiA family ribosome-associated protein [Planctomycetota bacterium]
MIVDVTSRSAEIPDALKGYARQKLMDLSPVGLLPGSRPASPEMPLSRSTPRILAVLSKQGGMTICELQFRGSRGESWTATEQAKEARVAVDGAVQKLNRQRLRWKEKRWHKNRRRRAAG